MKLLVATLFALACAHAIAGEVNVITIARPNRLPPTSNTYILYDDTQVLVVDLGKVLNDTVEVVQKLEPLLTTRQLNGFFITHGHPDHCTNAYYFKKRYDATVWVGSAAVQTEMVVLMDVFGNFLNASSPGNPDGDASDKFDYGSAANIQIAAKASDIWTNARGDSLNLYAEHKRVAETNHFAYIDVQKANGDVILIGGDLIYVDTHVFMGLGVGLAAQCDWLNFLVDDFYPRYASASVTLYPGHGPVATGGIKATLTDHVNYVNFAAQAYSSTCSADAARSQILNKYPNLNDPLLFTDYTLPYRVPFDATNLGCDCQSSAPCTTRAPACFIKF
jgi:glyoxylase-like metal-dependent hydrolase (beta-lactamase superfamily II)